MPIYRGKTPLKAYKGDHRPVNIYKGNTKIAGWLMETKSGEVVDFENTYNDKAEVLVSGKSEQVQTVQGKNLFDITKVKNLAISTTIVSSPMYRGYYCPCKPNTLYSVRRVSPTTNRLALCFTEVVPAHNVPYHNVSSDFGLDRYGLDVTIQATSGPNSKYVFIYFSNSGHTVPDTMLCEGEISEYEPFVPDSPSPDYPSPVLSAGECNLLISDRAGVRQSIALPPLRKIGDVADTYNPETGEYVQRIGVKVFDGTENISTLTFSHEYSWIKPTNSSIPARTGNIMCSHFAVTTSVNAVDIGTMRAGAAYLNFNFDNGANGIAHFKTWLADQYTAGTPVTVYYVLAEPIITHLDPVTVPTYYPTTIIETDSAVAPTITATVKVMD